MTDERNFVPVNDEQWVGVDHSEDFLPIMLEYVSEKELPYILTKIGHDTKDMLKYQDGKFKFIEELFATAVNYNEKVIGVRKQFCQAYLSETSWMVQEKVEFGTEIPLEIQEERLKAYTYLKNH